MKLSLGFLGSEVACFQVKRSPVRALPALDLDDDAPTLLMARPPRMSARAPSPADRAAQAFATPLPFPPAFPEAKRGLGGRPLVSR